MPALAAERETPSTMDAREITLALGGQWHGSYGMAQCPGHDDGRTPALKLSDDDRKDDGLDVVCFAGCDWRDVKAALRERGLLPEFAGSTTPTTLERRRRRPKPTLGATKPDEDTRRRIKHAREMWRQSQSAAGTLVETYLRSRAITRPAPPSLRFHPNLTYGPTGTGFPAMVAAVQDADGKVVAVHRTYLAPDGGAKAQASSPKMALGPLGDGAVRLARAGEHLGLAEGIETALSAMQLFDVPCWAALGSRLERVALTEDVRHVTVYADNGQAGREAATKAAETITGQGRKVTLRFPPDEYPDWNDALQALQAERVP